MFPAELFRVAVTVQYGPQRDYPYDFNISKNRISVIIIYLEEIVLFNERIINMITKSMGGIVVLYPIIRISLTNPK